MAASVLLFLTLSGCQGSSVGFYLYPQALATPLSEVHEAPPLAGLEVVGYLPSWKIGTVRLEQTRHLTDLVYFSLSATAQGELATKGLTPEHLDFLLKVKKEYGVHLLLGITDHRKKGALSTVVASPELRARFARNLTAFLKAKNFDGADFDWEYPSADQELGYEALLAAVKAEFGPEGFQLSVALSPSHPLSRAGYEVVDRVHGMLYDDEGKHSTLQKIADHVERMIRDGVDPAKLQLGLPFYGRGYTSRGPKWSSAVSYKDLQQKYSLAPGQDVVSGYYFNGIDTIRQKVRYAKLKGLAGLMVWEIGQDTTDASSLLAAISETRLDLAKPN